LLFGVVGEVSGQRRKFFLRIQDIKLQKRRTTLTWDFPYELTRPQVLSPPCGPNASQRDPVAFFYFAVSLKEIGTGNALAVAVQPRFINCTGSPWYLTCEKPVSYLREISVVPYRVCRHVSDRIITVSSYR
jgi:hypothetical protein